MCFILFLILPFKGYEQTLLGLEAIYTNNYPKIDFSNRSYTTLYSRSGVGAGISLTTKLSGRMNIQASLEAVQKSYLFERFGRYQGVFERCNNTYLQMPFFLKFSVFKMGKYRLRANGGTYFDFWLLGTRKGSIPNLFNSTNDSTVSNGSTTEYLQLVNYNEKYKFNAKVDNRLEIGWVAGLGLDYSLRRSFISVNIDYYSSLTSQQKKAGQRSSPQFNRTLTASLGFSFDLKQIF